MAKASTEHSTEPPSFLLDEHVGRVSCSLVVLGLRWIVVLVDKLAEALLVRRTYRKPARPQLLLRVGHGPAVSRTQVNRASQWIRGTRLPLERQVDRLLPVAHGWRV